MLVRGRRVSSSLGASLGGVSAYVPPFEVVEDEYTEANFFAWLDASLPPVPSIVEKSCNFASLFNAEATLNLLEMRGCRHVGDLADPSATAIGPDCREGTSEAVQQAARRVIADY